MFSGIIEHLGTVKNVSPQNNAIEFAIDTGIEDLSLGESIAVNGVCLTVTSFDVRGLASFFISPETLARTALGAISPGHRVNLERACTPSTRLSGHIVQGHVDEVGKISSLERVGDAHALRVAIPQSLRRYIVEKGSITLDGISLTVNSIIDQPGHDAEIGLMIIPHSWEHTTLSSKSVGDALNIEVDVIAKYVETLTRFQAAQ